MKITRQDLEETYRQKSDDELLELSSSETLTEVAREVISSEIKGRGLYFEDHDHINEEMHQTVRNAPPAFKESKTYSDLVLGIFCLGIAAFLFIVSKPINNYMSQSELLYSWAGIVNLILFIPAGILVVVGFDGVTASDESMSGVVYSCPHCNTQLDTNQIFSDETQVYKCPHCGGLISGIGPPL